MEKNQILLPAVEIVSLPLGETSYNLVYEISDLGISSDRVPAPLIYHHHYGVHLVNPGPLDDAKPTLEKFTTDGRRFYRISLTEKLNLDDPLSFLANQLFIDSSGNLSLLASLTYNTDNERDENFIVANFDSQGNLFKITKMERFIGGNPTFRSNDGYLWTFHVENVKTYWCIYNLNGELERQIETNNNCFLLPSGKLLSIDEAKAIVYDKTGQSYGVQLRGSFETLDVLISGNGNYFGILTYPDDVYKERSDGYLEQSMVIQLCYFDPALSTVFILGKQNLKPNIFDSEDIPNHFEYYDHDLMSFDEDGNFYFIVRNGPKQPYMRVFRMSINPDIIKSKKSSK